MVSHYYFQTLFKRRGRVKAISQRDETVRPFFRDLSSYVRRRPRLRDRQQRSCKAGPFGACGESFVTAAKKVLACKAEIFLYCCNSPLHLNYSFFCSQSRQRAQNTAEIKEKNETVASYSFNQIFRQRKVSAFQMPLSTYSMRYELHLLHYNSQVGRLRPRLN